MVCRETILPSETMFSIQPTNLGDTLDSITTNNKEDRRRLSKDGGAKIDGE